MVEDRLTHEELIELRRLRDKIKVIANNRIALATQIDNDNATETSRVWHFVVPDAISLTADVVALTGDEYGSYGYHERHAVGLEFESLVMTPEAWVEDLRVKWIQAAQEQVAARQAAVECARQMRRQHFEALRREFEVPDA